MAAAPTAAKNAALIELARLLRTERAALRAANAQDLDAAEPAWPRRWSTGCKLTAKIIDTVAEGCEQIAAMPDPIGEIIGLKRQPERHRASARCACRSACSA